MPRVLVIEDDAVNRMLLECQLEDLGCEIDRAPDGAVGLEMVQLVRPDVIVLDLNMPQVGGLAFLRTLRGMARGADIPVVVVTAAMMDKALQSQLVALDVRRTFSKGSYNSSELMAAVGSLLRMGAK